MKLMISSVKQLNAFIDLAQVKSRDLIIPELIKRKERISADMAKLITEKQVVLLAEYV